jgi:hypothetical protein
MVEEGVGDGTNAGLEGVGLEAALWDGFEKMVEETVSMENAGTAGVALEVLAPTSGGEEAGSGGVGAGGGVAASCSCGDVEGVLLSSSSSSSPLPLFSLSLLLPALSSLLSSSTTLRRPRDELPLSPRSAMYSSTALLTNISSTFPIHCPTILSACP